MKFDYIVVGSGVIGSSVAYYLKKALPESRILLIDRNAVPGAGNTAKSAALYRNIFSSGTSRALAGSSIKYYIELGDKVKLDPIGYLWLFSKEQWNIFRKCMLKLDHEKHKFEILDMEAISGILRINTKGKGVFSDVHTGIYCHLCGSISATMLTRHYVSEFKSLGGEVMLNTDIISFILTGQESCYAPWDDVLVNAIIDQEGNAFYSTNFIIATGAWTHELLAPIGIASNILPKKRQIFVLNIKDHNPLFADNNSTKKPVIILPEGGVYIKPVPDKDILICGCADDLGQPYLMSNPEPDPVYFNNAIRPVLSHYFSELKDFELSHKWAGYYDYHWPDMTPIIESMANLTWVGGTSGSGIMKADAIGRITAARLQGHRDAVLADGSKFNVSKLSLRDRDIEKEELII